MMSVIRHIQLATNQCLSLLIGLLIGYPASGLQILVLLGGLLLCSGSSERWPLLDGFGCLFRLLLLRYHLFFILRVITETFDIVVVAVAILPVLFAPAIPLGGHGLVFHET